jgi:hypothetical protein
LGRQNSANLTPASGRQDDFAAKRLGAALDLSLIQAYSNFHRLMLRGKNNRVGSFRAKIELGGFVGLPDAKWDERAHAVIVPRKRHVTSRHGLPLERVKRISWEGLESSIAPLKVPRRCIA